VEYMHFVANKTYNKDISFPLCLFVLLQHYTLFLMKQLILQQSSSLG
jgi:hypothetical protein